MSENEKGKGNLLKDVRVVVEVVWGIDGLEVRREAGAVMRALTGLEKVSLCFAMGW
jgi:hypothetical protein